MLSDPQSVTWDGSARSLPRVSSFSTKSTPRKVGQSTYRTADGTYAVATRQFEYRDTSRRAEIELSKQIIDPDASDGFTGVYNVGVALSFVVGPRGLGSSEIANIRAAILAYVDSTLQGRLIAGEV